MSETGPNIETLNKLFLELSQFTTVITDNESKLIDKNKRLLEYITHKNTCEKAYSKICTCGLDDLLE